MGRPSDYRPDFCDQARKLCRLGATDIEVADFLGVSVATLNNWKAAHPAFLDALKEGKSEADTRVVDSLYHRAVGYSFDSEKVQIQRDGSVVRAPIREHVPPDTTAAIFWLKNRRPQDWRDVHKHEVGRPGEFEDKSPDELRAFIAREAAALGVGGPETAAPGIGRGSRTKPH